MSILRTVLGRWMTTLVKTRGNKNETIIILDCGKCKAAIRIAGHNLGLDDRGV